MKKYEFFEEKFKFNFFEKICWFVEKKFSHLKKLANMTATDISCSNLNELRNSI